MLCFGKQSINMMMYIFFLSLLYLIIFPFICMNKRKIFFTKFKFIWLKLEHIHSYETLNQL